MRLDKNLKVFFDTTFLLPFFQINVNIEDFTLERFKVFLESLSEAHFSELSVFEAKVKIYKLSRKDSTYVKALEEFGENLTVLREDERFVFHEYTMQDDKAFNLIISKNLGLDSFDAIITAQALSVSVLITEDEEILSIRKQEEILKDSILREMKIIRWKELSSLNL